MLKLILLFGCFISFLSVWTCLSDTSTVLTATQQKYTFYFTANPAKGPRRLSSGWYDLSPISCATKCFDAFIDCTSFLYNSNSGLCTPGSEIAGSKPAPIAIEGDLYYTISCDTTAGFSIQSYGSTAACVGIFGPKVNYTEADVSCKRKDAFLISVKTMDKLRILRQIWDSTILWVGCDNLESHGTYRWREDGEVLTNTTIGEVFGVNELSRRALGQDCVNLGPGTGMLGDYYCSLPSLYACEIPKQNK